MEGTYPIYQQQNIIGTVQVTRQGLYLCFTARICCGGKPIGRLWLRSGDGVHKLGVPVPEGEELHLWTRIPAKQVRGEDVRFWFGDKEEPEEGTFYSIDSQKPFEALAKLPLGTLQIRNGQPGLQISSSSPTGQWSEPNTSE